MSPDPNHLIWIDLEMTGLDPDRDRIIEIATLVTDGSLEVIEEGPVIAVHQDDSALERMDEWNVATHGESGLITRVRESTVDEAHAERATLEFLHRHVPPARSPMCGNSICMDRRFLFRWMPGLEGYFHYRNLDVSTVKELCLRWAPEIARGYEKDASHRALDDIHDSLGELRYYRRHFLNAVSPPARSR